MTEMFPRWLYACFLAVDGNFRLKLKSRGINDPEISSRWSYFVENKTYMQHISENTIETEVLHFDYNPYILSGRWLQFLLPRCQSGEQQVIQRLHSLWCRCLRLRTPLSYAKEWRG